MFNITDVQTIVLYCLKVAKLIFGFYKDDISSSLLLLLLIFSRSQQLHHVFHQRIHDADGLSGPAR